MSGHALSNYEFEDVFDGRFENSELEKKAKVENPLVMNDDGTLGWGGAEEKIESFGSALRGYAKKGLAVVAAGYFGLVGAYSVADLVYNKFVLDYEREDFTMDSLLVGSMLDANSGVFEGVSVYIERELIDALIEKPLDGCYFLGGINIDPRNIENGSRNVFFHELGHHFSTFLDDTPKQEFRTLLRSYLSNRRELFNRGNSSADKLYRISYSLPAIHFRGSSMLWETSPREMDSVWVDEAFAEIFRCYFLPSEQHKHNEGYLDFRDHFTSFFSGVEGDLPLFEGGDVVKEAGFAQTFKRASMILPWSLGIQTGLISRGGFSD